MSSKGERPSANLRALKAAAVVRERVDNWINTVTGLGTVARDKVESTTFQRRTQLTDDTLEGIYHEDPLGARIVESIPKEAFRQGIGLTTTAELEAEEKADAEKTLREALKNLEAHQALQEAAIWGRLFGGGGVLLGANDGRQLHRALQVDAVKEVRFLTVLDKRDLVPETLYSDPREAKFGETELYRLQPTTIGTSSSRVPSGTRIHETRLIMFGGVLTSRRERQRLAGWDHSVLHRVQSALRAYSSDWASVSNMLTDSSQGVLKIKGLYELLAGGQKDQFTERLEIMALARFVGRILPIDQEEDFTYQERSFSGLSELMDRTMLRMSAATGGIPISVLFGRAPSGLSGDAAGGSDTEKWYNLVQAEREQEYGPAYDGLVRVVAQAVQVPEPDTWSVTWPSLWQMTPEQEAGVRKTTAETDQIYLNAQVLDADEVRARRFASGEENNLEPPQVELEAAPEPEDPGTAAAQVTNIPPENENVPPPPEAVPAEEEAEDAAAAVRLDSPWASAIPPVIGHDLRALRQLARTDAPQVVLRRLVTRLTVNLGLADQEVLDAIASAELGWQPAAMDLDFHWPSAEIQPSHATDLVAFETLVRVQAPQELLRRLASRIASGLGLSDDEIQTALEDASYRWIAASPGANPVDVNLRVSVEGQGDE